MFKNIFNPVFKYPLQNVFAKRLWQPTDLGIKDLCWLDFTDESTMSLVDGRISSITDKSANARVFGQGNAGNRPEFNANGSIFRRLLDYLVYEYDGAVLTTGVFANVPGGFRIFATVINESESAGSDGVLISESQFTADSRPHFSPIIKRIDGGSLRNRIGAIYRSNSSGSIILTSANTTSDVPSLSLTEYNLISMSDDGSTYRNFTNTVQSDETSYTRAGVTLTPTNRVTIGALLNSSGFGSTGGWIIRDILVTSNDLTTDELDRVNGAMAWRAGTQAKLPSNHPYRYQPPYI